MHRKFYSLFLLVLSLSILTSAGPIQAQYTDYKDSGSRQLLFTISFDKDNFGYTIMQDGDTLRTLLSLSSVDRVGATVTSGGKTILDRDGLHVNGTVYSFSDVTDIDVYVDDLETSLDFYARADRTGRVRRGNIIEPTQEIVVQEEEFIRGTVFSLTGDIEIHGEVNKDVISLFGDVAVGDAGVVRGNVVSIAGKIRLAKNAAVYGKVSSGTDDRIGRRHKYRRFQNIYDDYFEISCSDKYNGYNRVDGLSLGTEVRFSDPDSVLPSVWAGGGYAFESERWRYELGLEQTLLRNPALGIGGKAFRLLESDDSWLISNEENSAFALLLREDYRDYYEAEGGALWLHIVPLHDLNIETGFRYEETKWLDAERDLWSLLKGEDKFAPNFSRVDSLSRAAGIGQIDSFANASAYMQIGYDSRNIKDPYYRSAWSVQAQIEKSTPDLDSDYDYTRYRLSVARHQKVNRRTMVILRGVYGGSDGVLPMHRRFYLGGLGTLYGYRHKEYSGSYFWMANSEYRIDFPHSDVAASLMWDVGQTAETSSFANSEVKHSLGVSIYCGSDFKIGLAKRLDRSYDDDPRLFARLSFSM
jgi:hypothetical protein